MKDTKKMLPQIIVGVVVVGAVAFYGGMKYGESKATAASVSQGQGQRGGGQNGGANGGRMGGGNRGGAGFANGEVLSADTSSMIVKMRDGSSKNIILSNSTQVLKSATGTISDVTTGTQVTVVGSANTDGSITAQSVQIRPNMPSSTPAGR